MSPFRLFSLLILIIFFSFGSIVGCDGGGDGDNGDCPDISGIALLLFTETSNDCGLPLEPPFLVTADCSQRGCSLNCTFTDDEGESIDASGSISEDGIVDLFGTDSFEDPGPPPLRENIVFSFFFEVTDEGDLISGTFIENVAVIDLDTGLTIFSCNFVVDITE